MDGALSRNQRKRRRHKLAVKFKNRMNESGNVEEGKKIDVNSVLDNGSNEDVLKLGQDEGRALCSKRRKCCQVQNNSSDGGAAQMCHCPYRIESSAEIPLQDQIAGGRPYLCPFPTSVNGSQSASTQICIQNMQQQPTDIPFVNSSCSVASDEALNIYVDHGKVPHQEVRMSLLSNSTASSSSVVSIMHQHDALDRSGVVASNRFEASFTRTMNFPPSPALDEVAPVGRKGQRVYLYGNYHRYYGYRTVDVVADDPRLSMLQKHWFARKRCMDVGCNEGVLTLTLSSQFGTRSMVGVDLDEHLISRACRNLRESRSKAVDASLAARRSGSTAEERRSSRIAMKSLAQTWFVHADFLEARYDNESIDTLTAFSVTKWIHLHRGDDGLRSFFARVQSLLVPGGLFILEPQPWKSYKSAVRKVQQSCEKDCVPKHGYFHRLSDLRLKPENFVDVLQQENGFRLLKQVREAPGIEKGFERPIYLFQKVHA